MKSDTDPKAVSEAASDYAQRGWRVVPVHSVSERVCSCRRGGDCPSPGKHPRTRSGVRDASADANAAAQWWRNWPTANVAVATGNGLFVVDVDAKSGGLQSLRELESRYGSIRNLGPVARTGGGGWHIYFADSTNLGNSVGKLTTGIDTRGFGGYVVAPPSLHHSGKTYRWKKGTRDLPLPELPAWLRQRLEQAAADPDVEEGSAFFVPGQRNDRLTRFAGSLRAQGFDSSAIEHLLGVVNEAHCTPPLDSSEVAGIARSIGRKPTTHRNAEFRRLLADLDQKAFVRFHKEPTPLAVLRIFYRYAEKLGRTSVGMSVRDAALEAGLSNARVSTVLRRLIDEKWLEVTQPPSSKGATVYTLHYPLTADWEQNVSEVGGRPTTGNECSSSCRSLCRNLWRHRVLGKRTGQVFAVIRSVYPRSLTTHEIALFVGLEPRSVRYHLAKLDPPKFGNRAASANLVTRTVDGYRWSHISACRIAAELGVGVLEERQRKQIEGQRTAYKRPTASEKPDEVQDSGEPDL